MLVARKMPRLCSALGLDFGHANVISDMAIPLSKSILQGRRVAIVDDFINAGSTMDRVERLVRDLGAEPVDRFAIASRSLTQVSENSAHFVCDEPLGSKQYAEVVSTLPRVFDSATEAYDLEFPHIPCRYSLLIPDIDSLVDLLGQEYGSGFVHQVPGTWLSARRVTLALRRYPDEDLRKIRIYEAADGHGFIVVPISVPSQFGDARAEPLVQSVLDRLQSEAPLPAFVQHVMDTDVKCRAELLVRSLDLFFEFAAQSPAFEGSVTLDTVFDVAQATLAFGPNIQRSDALELLAPPSGNRPSSASPISGASSSSSPFASSKILRSILNRIESDPASDPKRILHSAFEVLGELVCSQNPASYALDWPYTPDQIRDDPYLRLRIGPTFSDLVTLLTRSLSIESQHAEPIVSRFLDTAIDAGVVVPTIGCMDGGCYRIYRKGEANAEARSLKILDIAVADCKAARDNPAIAYTDTHISKVTAALTFSGALPGYFGVKSKDRGTVAVTRKSVLSDGGDEVGKQLRIRRDRADDS